MRLPLSPHSLLSAVAVAATALALLQPATGWARVGVTSATDGDPLGKPPNEVERVLRLGIDVQANEVISTNANDRAHLVFLDGTALTIGPNARIVIDKFVYDPRTKTGDLALSASKGVLRLVGGKISKTNTVTITTPSSTIGIRGGIAIVNVTSSQTTSTFVFGQKMTVQGLGQTTTTTKPGTSVVTQGGGPPGPANPVNNAVIAGDLGQLDGSNRPGPISPMQGGPQQITAPDLNTGNATTIAGQTNTASTAIIPSTITTQVTTGPTTPYVNGAPSTVAALNELNRLNATAVYNGQVSGNVNGNPAPVIGTYQNIWSFGTRSGNTTVKFDATTYTGTTNLIGNGPNFATTTPLSGGSRSMTVNGGFYSSATDPAKTQTGTFSATGPGYSATGTFNAKK